MQPPLDVASVCAALENHNAEQELESEWAASLSDSISSLRVDHEALTIGTRVNGKMTVIRRNFCLFVLFDLLVVSFIWLILEMLAGDGDPMEIFNHEIIHYTIKSSLFDLVMAAGVRFTILLLFYAVLNFNTKFFVALTTAGTCAFLLFKVIYFNWKESNQAALQGVSFLVSFSLSWGEVWFLDMRVVPIEEQARQSYATNDQYKRILRSIFEDRFRRQHGRHQPDDAGFFTPLPYNDYDEDEGPTPQETLWLREASIAEEAIRSMLAEEIKWSKSTKDSISIGWSDHERYFNYCKIEAVLDFPAELVLHELFDCAADFPKWNESLQIFSRYHQINAKADVCYQQTKPRLSAGMRDMVFVRSRVTLPQGESIVFVSIDHDPLPKSENCTRAIFKPSCWIVQKDKFNPLTCHLTGLVHVDVKANILNYIFRKFTGESYLSAMKNLRRRLQQKAMSS